MASEKEKLSRLRLKTFDECSQVWDEINVAEENVAIYEEMMSPIKTYMLSIDKVFEPNAIGILSRFPWYDFFRDWLCQLYISGTIQDLDGTINHPMERSVINLLNEVPLPPPGKCEISIHLDGLAFYCSRPPVNTLGQLKNVK